VGVSQEQLTGLVSLGGLRRPSTGDQVATRIKIVQRGDRGMPDGGRRELSREGMRCSRRMWTVPNRGFAR
jgi:hypothetical protein